MTDGLLAGRRTLVTGATGFIGRSVVAQLHRAGAQIDAVSRQPPTDARGARWHACDLVDAEAVRRVVLSARPEVIFHLAGETHAARDLALVLPTFSMNLVGTVNLLTAAAETSPTSRILIAGSFEEPGPHDPVSSPYSASKAGARTYAGLFRETFGLDIGVLRVFMAYGAGQRDLRKLVPYVVLSLLRGERPQLTSGVRPIDWIYVDDVAAAFLAAATVEDAARLSIDVGSGEAVTIRALVDRLAGMIDPDVEPEFGAIADRPLEQVRVADVDATEASIGWRPQVGLDEGLTRTIEWYRRLLEREQVGLD